MATHAWFPFVPMLPQAPPSEQEEDSPLENSGSMKGEMIHLYLNNSTMALAIPREACLLGAPRCHGIGMLVGAFGICKEQEQTTEEARALKGEETPTVPEVERVGPTDGDGEGRGNVRGRRERRRRRGWGRQTATKEADKAATERAGDTDGNGGGGQGGDAGGGIATRLRATESDLMRCDVESDLMRSNRRK
uniref:Uncharacterized protein n=1 Tax=Oryza glumipatula TaxID=40148 RepID=A0A0E0A7I1_9ORYZ